MDITANVLTRPRSRSRSRTRNSTANSRSTSSTRRPSLGSARRSLLSSSLNRLVVTATPIDSQSDRSVPTTSAVLDNTLPIEFFKQDLIDLVKVLKISKWHKHASSMELVYLLITRILGALTNSIYKIEYKNHSSGLVLPALLLRVYGKNLDSIIDRESELKTLIKLSQKRIGPRLLGIFSNGRFEQFLEGYVTLTKDQIRDEVISQMIGRRMKDLHTKIALEQSDLAIGDSEQLPMSWVLIYKWLDLLEEQLADAQALSQEFDHEKIFYMSFRKFRTTIDEYKEWLFAKYDTACLDDNFRFCHNDTQYGNLLLHETFNPKDIVSNSEPDIKNTTNKKDASLVVIDFEYSGPNFPAYDLVNHFSEWMADYHDPKRSYFIDNHRYPTKIQQFNTIKSYIEYDFQYPSSNLRTKTKQDLTAANATELIESEMKKLFNECVLWRPTVQIYWALWGLIQNGPFVKEMPTEAREGLEHGVGSTYSITTELENLNVAGEADDIEDITSADDDFDYLKYSQEKIALAIADLVQFGLFDKADVPSQCPDKLLDCELFDI